MTELRQRVLNGAMFLDQHVPGWRDKINIDDLNIRSGCYCILGQIYGDYEEGAKILNMPVVDKYHPPSPSKESIELGFNDVYTANFGMELSELTNEWKSYLLECL